MLTARELSAHAKQIKLERRARDEETVKLHIIAAAQRAFARGDVEFEIPLYIAILDGGHKRVISTPSHMGLLRRMAFEGGYGYKETRRTIWFTNPVST